jgi:hypothetical protein
MAKYDPYEWMEKELKLRNTKTNVVYDKLKIRIRKGSDRQFKNGYSAWDGWKNVPVYYAEYSYWNVDEQQEVKVEIMDVTRKGTITECILRYANQMGYDYDMIQALDRKGK